VKPEDFDEDELREWFERALRGSSRSDGPDRGAGGFTSDELRDALRRAGGDKTRAFDELRRAGLRRARSEFGSEALKAGRVAPCVAAGAQRGALVSLACQTDFLAVQAGFQALADELARQAVERAPADAAALLALEDSRSGRPLGDTLQRLISDSGERVALAAYQRLENQAGVVGGYVHHDAKKGALVSVTCSADAATAVAFLKQLCMHIVSAMPIQVADPRAEIPAAAVERERAVLLEQAWMRDDKLTVEKAVEAALGKGSVIAGFARFQIGK